MVDEEEGMAKEKMGTDTEVQGNDLEVENNDQVMKGTDEAESATDGRAQEGQLLLPISSPRDQPAKVCTHTGHIAICR